MNTLTALCLALVLAIPALAQTPTTPQPYKPTPGQPGRDAVWVPTTDAMVQKMFDHAGLTPQDFVIDLGSGDGRMIIAAAKRGARGLGVEFNNDLVEFSRQRAKEAGVADKAQFAQGDMYVADISKATVLALFLLPSNLEKLVPKFLDLPPGTRIVVNTYWVKDWTPDDTQTLESGCDSWCTSYLMIVPAKVQGTWRTASGVLTLKQSYQMIEGTLAGGSDAPVPVNGRLRGSAISLTIGGTEYEGSVRDGRIEAAAKGQPNAPKLIATRAQ